MKTINFEELEISMDIENNERRSKRKKRKKDFCKLIYQRNKPGKGN